jgi:hypothetical protein
LIACNWDTACLEPEGVEGPGDEGIDLDYRVVVVIDSRTIVDQPCALKILWFTVGTILEMRGKPRGFSPRFVTWKKSGGWLLWIHFLLYNLSLIFFV